MLSRGDAEVAEVRDGAIAIVSSPTAELICQSTSRWSVWKTEWFASRSPIPKFSACSAAPR